MPYYKIAGLKVFMEPEEKIMLNQGKKYLIQEDDHSEVTPDIIIEKDEKSLVWWKEHGLNFTDADCEYMSMAGIFYREILKFNGMMLHSSAVVYENKAYLFSAPSGTGKSTHTSLWIETFRGDNVYILNDDKPAIRCIDGKYYAFGTPFSGKTDLSRNEMVPLQAICVLKRGEENKIKRMSVEDAILPILNQTVRPKEADLMTKLLQILDGLLRTVPVYQLECNISKEAVYTAYEMMRK